MNDQPKLFVSYSHDNEEHKKWVLKLATDLRRYMGVDVILDQWDLRIGNELALFMEQGLNESSLILCVCSKKYANKSNEGIGGVGYEKMILTRDLMKNTNVDYIIPIIRCNENKEIPLFLGTKRYLDFSDDFDYLNNLQELTARIYGQDIVIKPKIGNNPFLNILANEVKMRTLAEKTAYHNPQMQGTISFDYSNNSGIYIIGNGNYEFSTFWSECGVNCIYCYKDYINSIGYNSKIHQIPKTKEFSTFDFTSRTRKLYINDIVILMNDFGNFAAIHIKDVDITKDNRRSHVLSFEYKIYD